MRFHSKGFCWMCVGFLRLVKQQMPCWLEDERRRPCNFFRFESAYDNGICGRTGFLRRILFEASREYRNRLQLHSPDDGTEE